MKKKLLVPLAYNHTVTVLSPGTIANLSCGFDVLGLALSGVGDTIIMELTERAGIEISEITGADLPTETDKNVAGVALKAMLAEISNYTGGIRLRIQKGIAPGSGIGSSAASSAGAVWAFNHLLGTIFTAEELTRFAMEGERLASGAAHADNVAPALFGGITLVRSSHPLDVVAIPSPADLYAFVLHPEIELKTSDSRKVLKSKISLADGIRQWGNVGGLVAGFFLADYALISRSLEDVIIEPVRSLLIPGFSEMKQAALESGALGFGISGSGPSVFALCRGAENCRQVGVAISEAFRDIGLPFTTYQGPVNSKGVQLMSN